MSDSFDSPTTLRGSWWGEQRRLRGASPWRRSLLTAPYAAEPKHPASLRLLLASLRDPKRHRCSLVYLCPQHLKLRLFHSLPPSRAPTRPSRLPCQWRSPSRRLPRRGRPRRPTPTARETARLPCSSPPTTRPPPPPPSLPHPTLRSAHRAKRPPARPPSPIAPASPRTCATTLPLRAPSDHPPSPATPWPSS